MRAQLPGQIAVQLNHGQVTQPLHQWPRHRRQPRPDLNHVLTGLGRNRLHDVFNDVSVRQKMLTESLARYVFHGVGVLLSMAIRL